MKTINRDDLAARNDDFRAKKTKIKKTLPHKIPHHLDIGSCFRKPDGYWGTDIYAFKGVDQVFDHTVYPWPLPSNHFSKIRLWHIMQYLPDIDKTMKEIWRIAKPNAKVTIGVPYYMSILGFGDRARSFYTENTFNAFTDASWYKEERSIFTEKAKFRIDSQILRASGRFRRLIPFKHFLHYFLWNIYDEMEVHLTVLKNKKI